MTSSTAALDGGRTSAFSVDDPAIASRATELFHERYARVLRRVDRLLATLMLLQWAAAVAVAYWLSPWAWDGKVRVVHQHLYAAVLLGGAITVLPVALAFLRPGERATRYTVACGQMAWSALLIHLTGGRIETHFHVFGSLAILAFYRDVTVLVPATIVVAADHFMRGIYWPESVYGVANPEWWRFLEHAGWVVFIDVFLIRNCLQAYEELKDLSHQQAAIEASQERVVRVQRLAAVGQLAASVGHELRNPLAAVRNAHTYIAKRLRSAQTVDPKVDQFLHLIDKELDASAKIISNLLDFSRTREPARSPCPLQPLVADAIRLVPNDAGVRIDNEVSAQAPVPDLDRDQFRQVVINLIQNAVEAVSEKGSEGRVVVRSSGGGREPWKVSVSDNGPGLPEDASERIFQPLFSTKIKGTGLGLAVVQGIVERHGGSVRAERAESGGAAFVVELPPRELAHAAE